MVHILLSIQGDPLSIPIELSYPSRGTCHPFSSPLTNLTTYSKSLIRERSTMELTTSHGKLLYASVWSSPIGKAWKPAFGGTVKGDYSDRPFQVWYQRSDPLIGSSVGVLPM
jgi:hypothetical protein